ITRLEGQEPEKRTTLEPGGISAVDIIGSHAANLVRETGPVLGKSGDEIRLPEGSAFLLVQIEEGEEDTLASFAEHCEVVGVDLESIIAAAPNDQVLKSDLITIRETVPRRVN